MTWSSAATRAGRTLVRFAIGLLAYVDHRAYMRAYTRYLQWVGVTIHGRPRYVATTAKLDGTDFALIELGNEVVVSSGVRILTHDFSPARRDRATGTSRPAPSAAERSKVAGVSIGENSFVGAASILLPGTRIGRDCIIGAGSVVRGTLDDGSIVLGNPAEVVGSVYDEAAAGEPK